MGKFTFWDWVLVIGCCLVMACGLIGLWLSTTNLSWLPYLIIK